VSETLEELKSELIFLEKHMSRLQNEPELGRLAVDCANQIARTRDKIKKLQARAPHSEAVDVKGDHT
jgi:hypothetical protein